MTGARKVSAKIDEEQTSRRKGKFRLKADMSAIEIV